jgi:alkanesulfonate monooxygenase SsuD/methylene tetrahydromethanopterin reductase-like flavin-dependent oxidoreductase (luciferase family)
LLFERDERFDFNGVYYQANESVMLPRPQRIGGPTILIGGIGKKRSLPLAAHYADEWNAMFLDPKKFLELNLEMDNLLLAKGREPVSLKRSMMTGLRFGSTQEELAAKLFISKQSAEELRRKGIIVGVGDEIKDQLLELEKAGLQRIMLQWLDLDDLDGLTALAKVVL